MEKIRTETVVEKVGTVGLDGVPEWGVYRKGRGLGRPLFVLILKLNCSCYCDTLSCPFSITSLYQSEGQGIGRN